MKICVLPIILLLLANCPLRAEKQANSEPTSTTNSQQIPPKQDAAGPDLHLKTGDELIALGKFEEALESYRRALKARPGIPDTHMGIGLVFLAQKRFSDAEKEFREVLRLDPKSAKAHVNLGIALQQQKRVVEAMDQYRLAIKTEPDLVAAHQNLGIALTEQKQFDEALAAFTQALKIDSSAVGPRLLLGGLLLDQGKVTEAEKHFSKAIEIAPENIHAHVQLAICQERLGRFNDAIATYRKTLKLQDDNPQVLNNLAWLLATGPETIRDGKAAVKLAERACELTQYKVSVMIGTLGAAYAEAGRFPEAIKAAEQARELALRDGNQAGATINEKLAALYRSGKTARDLQ